MGPKWVQSESQVGSSGVRWVQVGSGGSGGFSWIKIDFNDDSKCAQVASSWVQLQFT